MSWVNAIATAAATPRQTAQEAAQTEMQILPCPPPQNAPQSRTGWLTSPQRIALVDAMQEGRTAKALSLALQAIADLAGDRELVDLDAQSRAAMGEEWKRAYKVWTMHSPRIRTAMTQAEKLAAYDEALDACALIADGTGEDGLAIAQGMLEMLTGLLSDRA